MNWPFANQEVRIGWKYYLKIFNLTPYPGPDLEAQIAKCDAVVIDELGYIPMDKVGAEHLFGFFSLCYERTSLVITTNLPFADWPRIFGGDERLAGALIDRLTHRINLLEILGDSYRFHSSLRKKKDGAIKDND